MRAADVVCGEDYATTCGLLITVLADTTAATNRQGRFSVRFHDGGALVEMAASKIWQPAGRFGLQAAQVRLAADRLRPFAAQLGATFVADRCRADDCGVILPLNAATWRRVIVALTGEEVALPGHIDDIREQALRRLGPGVTVFRNSHTSQWCLPAMVAEDLASRLSGGASGPSALEELVG